MGLIEIKDGIYYLTPDGQQYLDTKDLNFLHEVISKNIFAFEDILEFLKTSQEPQKEQEIFNYLVENLGVEWTTYAQINFRLQWLLNLNKIKKVETGYIINGKDN
jgi:hypothetical protein